MKPPNRPPGSAVARGPVPAMARRRLLGALAVLPLAGVTAACTGALPGQGPPPRLFRLTPKSTFGAELPIARWQLVIEVPIAPAGLDTTRIALHRNATELLHYARANWTDRAPTMAQTLIVESFENSGKIVAVGRESLGLRADYVLKTELREFQSEYAGKQPTAHVEINAKLVQMPRRAIVAAKRFNARVPAGADRIEDIVAAFDVALGKVLKDLVSWTLIAGDRANAARRPGS